MDWDAVIGDFRGLVTAIVEKSSKGAVSRELNHDKATVNRWLEGGKPSDPSDVAALVRLALKRGIEVDAFQTFQPIYDFSPMLSYEEKVELGPPKLGWLADPGVAIPEFNVELCGLKSDSPLGIASSPVLADERWAALVLNLGFGISTLKTRRTSATPPWEPPHIAFVLEPPPLVNYDASHPPEVEVIFTRAKVRMPVPNLVNSLGVPSDSCADWQLTYQRIQTHARSGLIGLSLVADGDTAREIIRDVDSGVGAAADVHPPFIELNISCPNLEKKCDPYDDVTLIQDICSRAKRITQAKGILLVLKLGYLPERKMKLLLESTGKVIDAVSFHNTLRVRPVARDRGGQLHPAFAGREFGGLSGPCTFQITRQGVASLSRVKSQLKQRFGIIAVGGVASYSDVVELMNAGADVVQACTAPIFDPLLALKVRFHLSHSSSILKRRNQVLNTSIGLLLPRDQVESDSFRELEQAVREIQRRSPEREISYDLMVATWNHWLSKRSAVIGTGSARRVTAGKRKAEWITELL
jgi:dihydroorotate dehydrogenase